jgi:catechol 2,3-dioxygenase-like lactoylglutathione lyase family enzyme
MNHPKRHIAHVTLLVPDYDEGIAFYVGRLGFELVQDTDLGDGKRWIVVHPGGSDPRARGSALLLAEPGNERQKARIGDQTGGRVGFFLFTDDFAADHARLRDAGVLFLEEPRHEAYGSVAVFSDPFGNKWDLLQPSDG